MRSMLMALMNLLLAGAIDYVAVRRDGGFGRSYLRLWLKMIFVFARHTMRSGLSIQQRKLHLHVDGIVNASAASDCSSCPMSGTVFTRSLRKSKRDSDMMHCLTWDVDNVLAFLLFVIAADRLRRLSTKSSSACNKVEIVKIL